MGRRVVVGVIGAGVAVAMLAPCAPRAWAPSPEPHPERQAWAERVDWTLARDEAVKVLSEYVAIDTSNPPGNEAQGAAYLADRLRAEGIEVETYEFAPGRANLIARLRADRPEAPPLCLLSHIDVATAEASAWDHAPFSGHVDDEGYLWGRGTLDMKGVGVLEVMSLVWLRRLGVPLRRDVVVLAVGDEEVDNAGVQDLATNRWDEIGCSHVLNEGGFGIRGGLVDDLTTLAVSFTEKGSLWVRLWAEGEPGHGSTPLPDTAPRRLMQALERLDRRKPEPVFHPELYALLDAVGTRAGGLTGAVLRSPSLVRTFATGRLLANPLSAAMLTNTVNVTGFGGAEEPNVIPGRVFAQLDIRMLPGVTSTDMIAELEGLLDGIDGLSFEVIQDLPAVESPTDDPVYEAIVARLEREFPDAAVGPIIMPGTTDSQVLRPLGVRCYGVAPFEVGVDELRGMHGDNERIHRDTLGRGLKVMLRIVLDAAARGEGDAVVGTPSH